MYPIKKCIRINSIVTFLRDPPVQLFPRSSHCSCCWITHTHTHTHTKRQAHPEGLLETNLSAPLRG